VLSPEGRCEKYLGYYVAPFSVGRYAWRSPPNHHIRQARRLYSVYLGSPLGAIVVLIPGLPLNMTAVFTQIIVAVLLVADLISWHCCHHEGARQSPVEPARRMGDRIPLSGMPTITIVITLAGS
jgi:hypothetical protein